MEYVRFDFFFHPSARSPGGRIFEAVATHVVPADRRAPFGPLSKDSQQGREFFLMQWISSVSDAWATIVVARSRSCRLDRGQWGAVNEDESEGRGWGDGGDGAGRELRSSENNDTWWSVEALPPSPRPRPPPYHSLLSAAEDDGSLSRRASRAEIH